VAQDKAQTISSKLGRGVTRRRNRKAENTLQAHSVRRRQRFEDEYRSVCYERFGKRDGFGLRGEEVRVA